MAEVEKEIKLLDVKPLDFMRKMEKLGASPKWKYIQDIYTFDFPEILESLRIKIKEFEKTGDRRGVITLLTEISPCFSSEERKKLQNLLGGHDILTYVIKMDDLSILNNPCIQDIILKGHSRFKKWIRLRKTGDETTITIKKIINVDKEYKIDNVEELEIPIPSIESGRELLQNLGYFPTNHQKKLRIAYDYLNTEVVLDKWPKIPPYVEIEGQTEDILNVVSNLGYTKDDIKVMNTDAVYALNGIDLYKFTDLDFDEEEEKQNNFLLNQINNLSINNHSLIAISGMPAAGKTTISRRLLSTISNLVYFDFGAFFRPIAFYLIKQEKFSIEKLKNIVQEEKIDELMKKMNLGYRNNNGIYEFSINGIFFEKEELYNQQMNKLTVDVGACFGDSLNSYIKNIIEDIRQKNPVILNARRPFSVCKDISVHIFLKADFYKRAERKAKLECNSLEEAIENLKQRDIKELAAGFWETFEFTKVIDTTYMGVDITTELVEKHILEAEIKDNTIE